MANGGRAWCDAALSSVVAATAAAAPPTARRTTSGARARSREAVFQRELDDAIVALTDSLEVTTRAARIALVVCGDVW